MPENIGNIQQIFRGNNVMLVNPNPGWPDYIMVLNALQEKVPPLVPFSLPLDLANQMYSKAFQSWTQMNSQVQMEKEEIRRRTNHPKPEVREHLHKYQNPEGTGPRTQPPPRPFLVRLDTKEGEKHYKAALKEAKEKNLPIPKAEDLAGQFPLLMAQASSPKQKALTKEMHEPKANWATEELRVYVENFGGYIGPKDTEKRMLEKAAKLFEARKKEYEADGFIVTLI